MNIVTLNVQEQFRHDFFEFITRNDPVVVLQIKCQFSRPFTIYGIEYLIEDGETVLDSVTFKFFFAV